MNLFLQILLGWALYELLRYIVVGAVVRNFQASAAAFVRRHRINIASASFIDRIWVRERLAQDPVIDQAILDLSTAQDVPPQTLRRRAEAYVEEIAPYFSMSAYYRFGTSFARRFLDFCFEMVVEKDGFERQMLEVPPDAVRVYVINHRANMDPLVLAYGLLRHVPMSYAVGEWALVWPLHGLFRRFGSYFVRRGEKDPLYHTVLERFVQLIAGQGAVTGFFIEGGLSRDGRLRPPRTGLLGYLINLRRDHPDREIVFMPVALNYDRVFEDRVLTQDKEGLARPSWPQRLFNLVELLIWLPVLISANIFKLALRSHKKLGNAAVMFGQPLKLSDWPGGDELHTLEGEERQQAMRLLGEELLLVRIAQVIPATPVPIFAYAFLEPGPRHESALQLRIGSLLKRLRKARAPLAFGEALQSIEARRASGGASIHEDLDAQILDAEEAEQVFLLASFALVRRRVLQRKGRDLCLIDGYEDVLRYYANSIAHHLE